jgi:hypothetical protein
MAARPSSTPHQLRVGHVQGERAAGHIKLDHVAVLDQRQRPADPSLRRDVEDASA